jgi:hypothetical protein
MVDLYKEAGINPNTPPTESTGGAPTDLYIQAQQQTTPPSGTETLQALGLGAAQEVANIPYALQRILQGGRPVPDPYIAAITPQVQMPRFTFGERAPAAQKAPTAFAAGRILGTLIPIPGAAEAGLPREATALARMARPAAEELISRAAPIAEEIPGLLGRLGRMGAGTLRYAVPGALYGGIYGGEQPQVDPREAAMVGAITGIGIGHLTNVAPHLFLKGIPASSAIQPHIANETDAVLEHYKGGAAVPSDINREVYNRVAQNYKNKYKDIRNAYNSLDTFLGVPEEVKGIEKWGVGLEPTLKLGQYAPYVPQKFDRSAYDQAIKSSLKDIDAKLGPYAKVEKISPKLAAAERKEMKNDIENTFSKLELNNFTNANDIKEDLNAEITDPNVSSARKKILTQLRKGVEQSVADTGSKSGNPNLRNAWKAVDTRFKNEIVPFRTSPFYKIYKGGGLNTDKFVEQNIKPKMTALSNKFLQQIPDDRTRQLAMAQYFRGAENNPATFMSRYTNLEPEQQRNLMPEHVDRLNYLADLYKKNKALFRPTTSRLERFGGWALRAAPWLGGGIGAIHYGGAPELGLAAMVEPFLATGVGHLAATSPAFREWYMQRLAQGLAAGRPELRAGIGRGITRAILGGMMQ